MTSFADLVAEPPSPPPAPVFDIPDPPASPRAGVYPVLKFTQARGFWWELTADPAIRLYWDLRLGGVEPAKTGADEETAVERAERYRAEWKIVGYPPGVTPKENHP